MGATTDWDRGPSVPARRRFRASPRGAGFGPAQPSRRRSGVGSLLQAFLQIALARVLAPPEYSALVSLFVVVTIFAVPTLGLQASVARDVATLSAAGREAEAGAVLRGTLRKVALFSIVALVIGAAIVTPLAIAFHVQRVGALVAAAVVVLATAALPVAWGGLQGTGRFSLLATGQVTWSALRFALALLLAAIGFGVVGAWPGSRSRRWRPSSPSFCSRGRCSRRRATPTSRRRASRRRTPSRPRRRCARSRR